MSNPAPDGRTDPEATGSFSLEQLLAVARSLNLRAALGYVTYPLRKRLCDARFQAGGTRLRPPGAVLRALLPSRPVPPADAPLGRLLSLRQEGQALELACDNGRLLLDFLAADLARFRLVPPGSGAPPGPPFSYALDPAATWPPVPVRVDETAEAIHLRTASLTCRVQRDPCRLSFYDAQGRPLSEAAEGLGFRGEGAFCTRRLAEGGAIYGLGEKAFGLNLRGRCLELWNTDPQTYAPGDDPIHLSVPFLVSLHRGRACGFFFDNPGPARLDLGQARSDCLRYEVDRGALCGYFFGGPALSAVLERYADLTGRMPLPPRWLLGYGQSRWSYYPEAEVRRLAAAFRERRIPCDSLYLDIHYMDGYRLFTWDEERFPDPPGLIADLAGQGFRTVCIVDPGVKKDPGYDVHDAGLLKDAFCRLPDGHLFSGPVWPGECYFPDFSDPRVRDWWGELYRSLLDAGVAGFWNDMNEPAIFGSEMPAAVRHHYEGHGADHGAVHNIYGLQMARASDEGLRRLRPAERLPVISRAGYAGLQRHALVWTGDNHSTWAHLRLSVSMCLNLGLSGLALSGPDVGGFAGDCTGELLARWTQAGALLPFFRNHSALGTAPQEPWVFGEPYESICRRWIELRYRLLPYVYTAAWQASHSGLPMMRPLVLAFPHDLRTYSLDDQFLLGDSLLAAPVGWPGLTARRVYLPGGPWYDFWTGARRSGEIESEAPLERMPLFVRAGTVLPMGPVLQHSGEWPPRVLELHVYPGDGQSWLYEDDGHSLDYQHGHWQRTRFACQAGPDGALAVSREVEGAYDPGYHEFDIQVHGLARAPRRVLLDGQAVDAAPVPATGTVRLAAGAWTRLEIE